MLELPNIYTQRFHLKELMLAVVVQVLMVAAKALVKAGVAAVNKYQL
jgi:hypothetical protein